MIIKGKSQIARTRHNIAAKNDNQRDNSASDINISDAEPTFPMLFYATRFYKCPILVQVEEREEALVVVEREKEGRRRRNKTNGRT